MKITLLFILDLLVDIIGQMKKNRLVVIKNVPRKDKEGNLVKRAMKVGNYNIFECGA